MSKWKSFFNHRKNPFGPNPTVTDFEMSDTIGMTHFNSVLKARAFLKEASCLPEKQRKSAEMSKKIGDALNVIRRADLRNVRRQIKRYKKKGLEAPANLLARYKALRADSCDEADNLVEEACEDLSDADCSEITKIRNRNCNNGFRILGPLRERPAKAPVRAGNKASREPEQPVKPVARWEEVSGPDGEVVRFKLIYDQDGKFKKRARTKDLPQKGDIVLDLTSGFKAWIITKNRRRPYNEITKEMRRSYENSFLYKVRQLASGQLSLPKFVELIKSSQLAAAGKKSKKLKKRNH